MERWPWQEGNWERPQSNQEILHRCSCDLPHPTAIVAKTSKEGTNYSFNMSIQPLNFDPPSALFGLNHYRQSKEEMD